MNKQLVMTILLFMLVVTGYNQFVAIPKAKAAQQAAENKLKEVTQENKKSDSVVEILPTSSGTKVLQTTPKNVKEEELITLNLPKANIVFSSKGAGIKTFLFKDVLGDVDLTPYKGEGYFSTLPQIDYVEQDRTSDSITFVGDIVPGIEIVKKYKFVENGINTLSLSFVNKTENDATLMDWHWNFGPGLATVSSEMKDNERESKAIYLVQEEGKKQPTLEEFTKNDKQPTLPWKWAGIENRYFLAVLVPQNWSTPTAFNIEREKVGMQKRMWGLFGEGEVKAPHFSINMPSTTLKAHSSVNFDSEFYFGPKDYTAFLKEDYANYHFDRSIAFGFFGTLGKGARFILEKFYSWTGNYGLAIIMITICLQAILCKFTFMQLKSAAQMKKIQPEMKLLQEKYKGDPQALNRETLLLYRKYKVNPLMGCLPLLIQLPIFLALFNALRTSWSLHGAPFVLWITDLSSKDPFYILPILMGLVMFFQQKGSIPAGTDPAQAAMFKYMPIIFTLLFMNFPSGLVLYWCTNSLLTFGIQKIVNKKIMNA